MQDCLVDKVYDYLKIFEDSKIIAKIQTKLPKQGTNPRGVEITNHAISELIKHKNTKSIQIKWIRSENENYTPYDRWIELWSAEN
jgi:hypothetical protein